jgi:beta-glucosidase
MAPRGRTAALAAVLVALTPLAAGGVSAGTWSNDEVAMAPARQVASQDVEQRVNGLLSRMTLDEKLQQLQLLSDGQVTDEDAKKGVGAVFSLVDPQKINHPYGGFCA